MEKIENALFTVAVLIVLTWIVLILAYAYSLNFKQSDNQTIETTEIEVTKVDSRDIN